MNAHFAMYVPLNVQLESMLVMKLINLIKMPREIIVWLVKQGAEIERFRTDPSFSVV